MCCTLRMLCSWAALRSSHSSSRVFTSSRSCPATFPASASFRMALAGPSGRASCTAMRVRSDPRRVMVMHMRSRHRAMRLQLERTLAAACSATMVSASRPGPVSLKMFTSSVCCGSVSNMPTSPLVWASAMLPIFSGRRPSSRASIWAHIVSSTRAESAEDSISTMMVSAVFISGFRSWYLSSSGSALTGMYGAAKLDSRHEREAATAMAALDWGHRFKPDTGEEKYIRCPCTARHATAWMFFSMEMASSASNGA